MNPAHKGTGARSGLSPTSERTQTQDLLSCSASAQILFVGMHSLILSPSPRQPNRCAYRRLSVTVAISHWALDNVLPRPAPSRSSILRKSRYTNANRAIRFQH